MKKLILLILILLISIVGVNAIDLFNDSFSTSCSDYVFLDSFNRSDTSVLGASECDATLIWNDVANNPAESINITDNKVILKKLITNNQKAYINLSSNNSNLTFEFYFKVDGNVGADESLGFDFFTGLDGTGTLSTPLMVRLDEFQWCESNCGVINSFPEPNNFKTGENYLVKIWYGPDGAGEIDNVSIYYADNGTYYTATDVQLASGIIKSFAIGISEVGIGTVYETAVYEGIFDRATIDSTPPSLDNEVTNFTIIRQNETGIFNITANDNLELDTLIFSIKNDTGTWENRTTVRLSGTQSIQSFLLKISVSEGGTQYWKFYVNDTSGNWNESRNFSELVVDSIPVITLTSPSDNLVVFEGIQEFIYQVDDDNNINNCSISLDGTINITNTSISTGITQSFNIDLSNGVFEWNISCYDQFNNFGESETRTINVTVCSPVFVEVSNQTSCLTNDTITITTFFNDTLCGTSAINFSTSESSCNFCSPVANCVTFSGICQSANFTEKCTNLNNTCFDQTQLNSDFVDLDRGCVGAYGVDEASEVTIDLFIAILIGVLSLASLIAFIFMFKIIKRIRLK